VIVVTAGTSEYRKIICAQARNCKEFGYDHLVYDLGGLGIGEPYHVELEDLQPTVNGDSLPPATFKAALVEKAFGAAVRDELVCWLDADCIPLREFIPFDIDGMMEGFDAAVTLRPAPEIGLSNNPALDYLNSGVVWIRNNEAGRALCDTWRLLSGSMNTDQGALNHTVYPGAGIREWSTLIGDHGFNKIVNTVDGNETSYVLVLDCAEWNCWHFPPPPQARILHFKRGMRYLAKDYLNR
jgi:hypothetical protein